MNNRFPDYEGYQWACDQGQMQAESEAAFALDRWKVDSLPWIDPFAVRRSVDEYIGKREAPEDVRKEMAREWCRCYYRRTGAILVHAISPGSRTEEDLLRLRVIDGSRWLGEPKD